jgi:hypothetical protein
MDVSHAERGERGKAFGAATRPIVGAKARSGRYRTIRSASFCPNTESSNPGA